MIPNTDSTVPGSPPLTLQQPLNLISERSSLGLTLIDDQKFVHMCRDRESRKFNCSTLYSAVKITIKHEPINEPRTSR